MPLSDNNPRVLNLTQQVCLYLVESDGDYRTPIGGVDRQGDPPTITVQRSGRINRWYGTPMDEAVLSYDGLPDPQPDVWLVVEPEIAILAARDGRDDVLYPVYLRDKLGRVIGCSALARIGGSSDTQR